MADRARYGRRRIDRMLAEWQALRQHPVDPVATQAAFDACEEWVDWAFGAARAEGEGK